MWYDTRMNSFKWGLTKGSSWHSFQYFRRPNLPRYPLASIVHNKYWDIEMTRRLITQMWCKCWIFQLLITWLNLALCKNELDAGYQKRKIRSFNANISGTEFIVNSVIDLVYLMTGDCKDYNSYTYIIIVLL